MKHKALRENPLVEIEQLIAEFSSLTTRAPSDTPESQGATPSELDLRQRNLAAMLDALCSALTGDLDDCSHISPLSSNNGSAPDPLPNTTMESSSDVVQ